MVLLDDLDPAQRVAVESPAAPLCIVAGAGSGKTRVLTGRIAHRVITGQADAEHVLALTFTRKAAGELRARLAHLGVRGGTAGTFHAVAWAQLRQRALDQGQRPPVVLRDKARLLARLLGGDTDQAAAAAVDLERAKVRGAVPADPALAAAYEQEKRRRGVVDFDDLLDHCATAIEGDRAFAEAQRWRFRHLYVDEFQDVNALQFRLLRAWLGDRPDLTVVGDPNQAVYGWNGADVAYLERFTDHFPTAETVRLDANYRSSAAIVRVASSVLGGAALARPPRHAGRPGGSVPTVRRFDTEADEARGIARGLRLAHAPGTPWSDLAVLARTHAQLRVVEKALRAVGIPHRSAGSDFLWAPEVRSEVRRMKEAPSALAFDSLLADLDELAHGDDVDNLVALAGLAREYRSFDPAPSGAGFASWLAAVVRRDDPGTAGDAVAVTTFHGAKGLEWRTVFVAGLEDGLVPVADGDEAEERRLLYVALSRAEQELHCSWAEHRRARRSPSPWLASVEAAVAELRAEAEAPAAPPAGWRRRLACGAERRPVAGDGALDALRRWRANQARAARVPAAVIVPDDVLAAVAAARPATPDELSAIPGLSRVRANAIGESLLAVVTQAES
ncbi:MAG: ATP-dependent DNA helicase UvrD2 [Actinobacteria bacterium]|nr:ATP-dependent DNA helicase UvrD2 [Actinomycetota bacterium]